MKSLPHVGLFLLTFLTAAFSGVQWLNRDPFDLSNFSAGLPYASLILTMLLSHELGHYFAARYHKIDASFPFFLPFPSFLFWGLFPFGTLGAVIRLREPVSDRRTIFDIGVSGPLAGIVVSIIILAVGFWNLPPSDYLLSIHPEYANMSTIPDGGLTFGSNLLFSLLASVCAPKGAAVPPMNEIYHYPFLCVGWFGIFVTTMNLLPVGQLDGGHVASAILSTRSKRILGTATISAQILFGLLGFLPLIGVNREIGWTGWLVWGVLLALFNRRRHGTMDLVGATSEIGSGRKLIGWICLAFFVITFSPVPISIH
jgi:membrane-associated protease RseP (regulator of RpoE activity)